LPAREAGCPYVLIEEKVESLINSSGELISIEIQFLEYHILNIGVYVIGTFIDSRD
jgi:hypothetical protein